MHQNSKFLLAGLVASTALLVFACKSLGTPEDQAMGKNLWTAIQGYHDWDAPPDWEGFNKSKSPHGKFVKIYVNSTLAGSLDDPAPGSIVVKEGFSKEDPDSIKAITVMEKVAGYGQDAGGWFYARYSTSGEMTHAGTPGMCADCHSNAGGDDFLYINDY